MRFSAIGLSIVYLTQSIGFVLTGQLPSIITRTGNPTSIVFALDFTLLIPVLMLGAIWLLGRQPWNLNQPLSRMHQYSINVLFDAIA